MKKLTNEKMFAKQKFILENINYEKIMFGKTKIYFRKKIN